MNNRLCSIALIAMMLVLPNKTAARPNVERADEVDIATKALALTEGKSNWSQKVLALHSFVKDEVKLVKTSYA